MNRRSFFTRLLAVPLAPIALKLAKLFKPSNQITCIPPTGYVSRITDKHAGIEPPFGCGLNPCGENPPRLPFRPYKYSLPTATGKQLDYIGELLKVPRVFPEWKFKLKETI